MSERPILNEPSRVILTTPELDRLLRNSQRYEWLRAGGPGTGLYVADAGRDWRQVKGEELDAAIDEALAPVKP